VRSRRLVLAALLFVAIAGAFAGARAQPRVERVEPAGTFTTNAKAWGRDAGNSARVGSRIFWAFGDTFTPNGFRCATSAWSSPDRPLVLKEEVDALGNPYQLYRFTPDEWAFNQSHAKPPACCSESSSCAKESPYCKCPPATDCATRIALWPGDVIAVDERIAINFYEKLVAGVAPYDFHHIGTGLARVALGRTVAARETGRDRKPLLLFSDPEPNFLRAVSVEEDGRRFVYVYASVNRLLCAVDVLIGRVRLESVADRASYRFWDGAGWAGDLGAARPILARIPGGLGSVAWSTHLRSYVSAFSDVCTGGKLVLRTAPRPEGPWSEASTVDLAALGATAESYAGMLHPDLGNGAEMWFTFYWPAGENGALRAGKIRFE